MNKQLTPSGRQGPELPIGPYRQLEPDNDFMADPDFESGGFDLKLIWRILWERKLLVIAAMGLGIALSLVLSLLTTPLYRSTASLELDPPTIPILNNDQADLLAPTSDREFLSTQYSLLKSQSLAAHVVEDLNLLGKPGEGAGGGSAADLKERLDQKAASLAQNLDVTPVPQSRVVELTFTSKDPREAARIVNGFAEAFISSALERRYDSAASARNFLQSRIATVRNNLNDSERKLADYARANGIINTGNSGKGESDVDSLQGASLVSLNAALAEAQQRRIAAEQRYRNAGTAADVSDKTASLRAEKAKLEADYRQKSAIFKDDYPDMVELRERIAGISDQIAKEQAYVSGSQESTLRSQYQAALAEERSIQAKVNQLKGSVMDLNQRSIQLGILKRQVDTNRALYDALLSRYDEIGVAGGIDTPQASIVDPGKVPVSPFSPNIPRNLLLGGFFGTVIGIGLAFALFQITDRISSPADVREKLRLPLLGVIPKTKRKEELANVLADQKSAISEAYASLATTLQFTTSAGIPRSLLITSTIAEEGKSTTSFVIASILAHHGKRVLLINADLRKPSFVVEESVDTGFAPMVANGGELERHIVKTGEENFWLMPSGPMPNNPVKILNSDRAARVIARAREMFDIVIVDAPPTYGFADAPLLAALCDGVLVLFESGKTRRRPALDMIERLRTAGANIIGAALTKYRFEVSEYGYRYYDAYGERQAALEESVIARTNAEKPSEA